MKEMFSISTAVDMSKAKSTIKTTQSTDTANDSSKNFSEVMSSQIQDSKKLSTEEQTQNTNINESEEVIEADVKVEFSNETAEKSVDDHALEDVLKIVTLLKSSDTEQVSFPSFSNKITKLINNEAALNELKSINNITDLVKLSKKYDLGLEKISVQEISSESLKKDFPALDKKGFFNTLNESLKNTKDLNTNISSTTEKEIKASTISFRDIEKPTTETKKEPSLLEKMMSATKEVTKKEIDPQQLVKDKIATSTADKKEIDPQQLVKDKIATSTTDKKEEVAIKLTEETKKTIKTVQEEAPKVVVKEDNKKDTKTNTLNENLHVKVDSEVKTASNIKTNETNTSKSSIFESILQNLKSDKSDSTSKISTITSSTLQNGEKVETTLTESSEIKGDSINKTEFKISTRSELLQNRQTVTTKETFSNFANDLKEKMENYKPPVMKVQLALNPKGLGEVDVTVINRGNNLHVNISSNANTMSLFTQNQAEFKNSLVNMGFTNLEMNFSDQGKNQDQQQGGENKLSNEFEEESTEELSNEMTSIEVVIPDYA